MICLSLISPSSSRAQTRDQWSTRTEPAKSTATCSIGPASSRGVNCKSGVNCESRNCKDTE